MKLFLPGQYQEAAVTIFLDVQRTILRILPFARVEHVGSSSIPGAMSKGDIDVCVIVDPNKHQEATSALEQMGYMLKHDTLRTSELCMLISSTVSVDLALQVISKGSRFEFFMTFRNALCNDPSLVQKYNEVKLGYQNLGGAAYREAKANFIEAVLRELRSDSN